MWTQLIDILFPPHHTAYVVRSLTKETLRIHLARNIYRTTHTLFHYHDEVIRSLIWQLKYYDNKKSAELLGNALGEVLSEWREPHYLVPIPLTPHRLRERGYNHVARVLQVAQTYATHHTILEHLLIRTHHHTSQTTLSRQERYAHLKGAFSVNKEVLSPDMPILLIDDVVTTGATLEDARRALQEGGMRDITTIALAH